MGTRSNINVKVGDKYHSVYCHWSGYVSHNGAILLEHYNSQELAEKLVAEGDMSVLGPQCDKPEGHSYDTPAEGRTVYYGRDRGEEGVGMQIVDEPRFEEAYSYVWDGEKWLVRGYDCDNITVEEALKSGAE